jgi:hypothetical protein
MRVRRKKSSIACASQHFEIMKNSSFGTVVSVLLVALFGMSLSGCSVGAQNGSKRVWFKFGPDADIRILSGGDRPVVVVPPVVVGHPVVQAPVVQPPQTNWGTGTFNGTYVPQVVSPAVVVTPDVIVRPGFTTGEYYYGGGGNYIPVGAMFGGGTGVSAIGGVSFGWGWAPYYEVPTRRGELGYYDRARHTYGVPDGRNSDRHPGSPLGGGGRGGPGPGLPGVHGGHR